MPADEGDLIRIYDESSNWVICKSKRRKMFSSFFSVKYRASREGSLTLTILFEIYFVTVF